MSEAKDKFPTKVITSVNLTTEEVAEILCDRLGMPGAEVVFDGSLYAVTVTSTKDGAK